LIHLDTNFLIALEDPGSAATSRLRAWLRDREGIGVSAIVWAEYLCGPLPPEKICAADVLVPHKEALLPDDAPLAAHLFNASGRRRGSMADCMIAAIAIRCGARFASLNRADFQPLVSHGLDLCAI
jgi:predicted nucleic acid-binding protein